MSDKIEIIRGDDQTITLTFVDGDNVAINLTGCTVFFTAKRNKSDSDTDAVIKVSQDTHIDATHGKTEIKITHAVSGALDEGDYFWDAQIKFVNNDIRSTMSDILTVVPDITRRVS